MSNLVYKHDLETFDFVISFVYPSWALFSWKTRNLPGDFSGRKVSIIIPAPLYPTALFIRACTHSGRSVRGLSPICIVQLSLN